MAKTFSTAAWVLALWAGTALAAEEVLPPAQGTLPKTGGVFTVTDDAVLGAGGTAMSGGGAGGFGVTGALGQVAAGETLDGTNSVVEAGFYTKAPAPPAGAAVTQLFVSSLTFNASTTGDPQGSDYLLQVATVAGFGGTPVIYGGVTFPYLIDGLEQATTYYLRAWSAYMDGERSAFTPTITAVTQVDLTVLAAVSTPTFPSGGRFVNVQPNFHWKGPRNDVAAQLGAAPRFLLEVANNLAFTTPVIRISTPMPAPDEVRPTVDGAYISTFTLTNNTTYFWRVRAQSTNGVLGPFSTPVQSFVTDLSSPVASAFLSRQPDQTARTETQLNPLGAGVTVQLTVQDARSGLSIASGAFGAMVSKDAGATWRSFAAGGIVHSGQADETADDRLTAAAAFGGSLYVGGSAAGSGVIYKGDGTTWANVFLTESEVHALVEFGGRLFAGTDPSAAIHHSPDGVSWTLNGFSSLGDSGVGAFAVFGDRLFAATSPSGRIYATDDGDAWFESAHLGVSDGVSVVHALRAFNGRLYAATDVGLYSSPDGVSWSLALGGSNEVTALAEFNGMLYAGLLPDGEIQRSANGTAWAPALAAAAGSGAVVETLLAHGGRLYAGLGNPANLLVTADGARWDNAGFSAPLEQGLSALTPFGGALYAGTRSGSADAKILKLQPFEAAIAGADGATTAQALTVRGLDLETSTNALTCGGSAACGATNQVRFSVSDRAGNVRQATFSVLVDTATPLVTTLPTAQAQAVFRRQNDGAYDLDLVDVGLAGLDRLQVSVNDQPGEAGNALIAMTNAVTGLTNPFTQDWPLPAAVFTAMRENADGVNYVTVRALDLLGHATTYVDAFVVLKDTTAPAIVVNSQDLGILAADPGAVIDVDVADAVSGLSVFQYSVSTTAGSADATVVDWTDIPLDGPGAHTTEWSVPFGALVNNATNYVSVRAWDAAGSTRPVVDAVLLKKDTSGPDVALAAPMHAFRSSLPSLSGTAFDFSGVAAVSVAIQRLSDSRYYDGLTSDFTGFGEILNPAAGTTLWALDAQPVPFQDNQSYRVRARGRDITNNDSPQDAEWTFGWDTTVPSAALVLPANGGQVTTASPLLIAGTAADPGTGASGLAGIDVSLRRVSDGLWWDFAADDWAAVQTTATATPGASWSFDPPALLKANLEHGATYYVTARSRDSAFPANAMAFAQAESTFLFLDVSSPSAVLDLSASTGPQVGTVELTWSAPGDDGAVGSMLTSDYLVQYATSAQTVWLSTAAQAASTAPLVAPGDRLSTVIGGLELGVTYYFSLWTRDDAGNVSPASNHPSGLALTAIAITGRVLQTNGQGLSAVIVEAFDASGALLAETRTVSDGTGEFEIGGLPNGTYRVQTTWVVNDLASSISRSNVPEDASHLDFTLALNYTLSSISGAVTVVSPSGARARQTGVRARAAAVTGAFVELSAGGRFLAAAPVGQDGRFHIQNLLPGTYGLRAYDGSAYTESRTVVLAEGQDAAVSLTGSLLDEASVFPFPNPASDEAVIRFVSAAPSPEAEVVIYDVAGSVVRRLAAPASVPTGAGVHHVRWDTRTDAGRRVASGVYLFVLRVRDASSGERRQVVRKLAVLR